MYFCFPVPWTLIILPPNHSPTFILWNFCVCCIVHFTNGNLRHGVQNKNKRKIKFACYRWADQEDGRKKHRRTLVGVEKISIFWCCLILLLPWVPQVGRFPAFGRPDHLQKHAPREHLVPRVYYRRWTSIPRFYVVWFVTQSFFP